jgi:hypothetical protein
MQIGVPRETKDQEHRVGMTPDGVKTLVEDGHRLLVEQGAGIGSGFSDDAYRSAGAALQALLRLGAKEVSILDADGVELLIPIAELKVDHRFIVRPGEKVATDGVVYKGISAIDRSLLTGESVPVDVHPGEPVTGATVNVGGGHLIVRATRVGNDTALAQIGRLVTDAQTGKAPVQRLADRVAGRAERERRDAAGGGEKFARSKAQDRGPGGGGEKARHHLAPADPISVQARERGRRGRGWRRRPRGPGPRARGRGGRR